MGPSLVLGLVSAVCTVQLVRGGFLFCLLYLLQNLQGSAQTFGEVRSDTVSPTPEWTGPFGLCLPLSFWSGRAVPVSPKVPKWARVGLKKKQGQYLSGLT